MAITLIKGRPGAGKSYECVVHHILPALKDCRKVVTNIPVNIEQFVKVLGEHVKELIEVVPFDFEEEVPKLANPDDYVKYQEWRNEKGQGVLFVLDECHYLFPLNGRGKAQTDLADRQIKFFSGHRHYGFDFIFLTQSDRKINKLLREDIEICIELRKNRAIGDASYRRYVFYYGDGKKGGLIDQDSRKYEKQYFALYQSHTKSKSSVEEAKPKDLKKWHQNWGIRISIIMILFGSFYVVKSLGAAFSKYSEKPPVTQNAPDTKKNVTKTIRPEPPKEYPFANFDFYISGYSDSSYKDSQGIYHVQKQVYFTGKNSARFTLDLRLDDFYLAGYHVAVYGPCLVKLTYDSFSKFVYCQNDKRQNSNSVVEEISSAAG